jgi:hypothetical protein
VTVIGPQMTRLPRTYAAAELTSPVFMLAVALLVLNDWVLKAAVGSWWTGKLSDFAGLFALATLVSALLPGHRRVVCASTAVGFLIWKSPASGPALAAWNSFDLWPLARVVDYTDWLAVLALVPVWRGPSRRAERSPVRRPSLARRAVAVAAAVAAIAAFTATSVARPNPLPNQRDYAVPGAPGVVRAALDSLGFRPERRGRKAPANAPDTVSLYVRHPPERWIAVRIEVRETAPGVSAIRLIERISQDEGPVVTIEALDRAFRAQVVEPLRDWLRRM